MKSMIAVPWPRHLHSRFPFHSIFNDDASPVASRQPGRGEAAHVSGTVVDVVVLVDEVVIMVDELVVVDVVVVQFTMGMQLEGSPVHVKHASTRQVRSHPSKFA